MSRRAEEAELDRLERETAEDPDGPIYTGRDSDELGPCEWFARCDRPATHLEPHPIIGQVPACDRCPDIGR